MENFISTLIGGGIAITLSIGLVYLITCLFTKNKKTIRTVIVNPLYKRTKK